ncbi:hypothetical protein [Desemzia sp. FAM 24101]|uniref:hypothetical protein n=1 Tax=unclassified Desemzia TaxID=2685243 RepID=UPI0038880C90
MEKIIRIFLILGLIITNIFSYQSRQSRSYKIIEHKIGISIKTHKRRCKQFFKIQNESVFI